ncbi:MAG: mevalonate kinase [Bacteroidota bacterium]|nr:mevalonate kinase [Bacteroidota bacterium]
MKFNAKILLFGEYAVLYQSDALVIPFNQFSGELDFINGHSKDLKPKIRSNEVLNQLFTYLEKAENDSVFFYSFNINQFKTDIKNGLFFNSTIPEGYGIGSSGALTAAIFSNYHEKVIDNLGKDQWLSLRNTLAFIESYFHGNSSGFDPLVSYLNKGFYVNGSSVQMYHPDFSIYHPFLIDTQKARSTEHFVNIFLNKCIDPEFENIMKTEFLHLNNQCIQFLRNKDVENFFSSLKELSMFQYQHFEEMIVPELKTIWMQGLESDDFYLKLCGAGGGGYLLGFAREKAAIQKLKTEYDFKFMEIKEHFK